MLNIYSYSDYRLYLKDLYLFKRIKERFFSYTYIAQKIQMDRSSLIKILKGERHLPIDKMNALTRLVDLDYAEAAYFEKMVYLGRSSDSDEQSRLKEELEDLKPIPQGMIRKSQYDFFNKWYYVVLWSMIGAFPCTPQTKFREWLSPQVPEDQIAQALQALQELELIELDTQGFYKKKAMNITLAQDWSSLKIEEYLRKSLELAERSIRYFSKEERDLSALIIDCPSEQLGEIKQMIADFRKKVIRKVNECEKSSRVYQMSIQLFPLTHDFSKVATDV